jgi:hypothetical protein
MTLSYYLQGLLAHFHDARIVRNITGLVQKIVEHTSIRLWSISDDKAEFVRSKRLVEGSLKAVLDEETVAEALREIGSREVQLSGDDTEVVVLLHDPSDIRKEYSAELECLGTVRALDGTLVPGYQTFDTVVMDEHGRTPQPLDVSVYSNGDPHYVTEEELSLYQRLQRTPPDPSATQKLPPTRVAEIRQFLDEDSYLNLYRVVSTQLIRVSRQMQAQYPHRSRCHVLDRQFDGVRYVCLIDQELHDDFVIRLKISRTVPGIFLDGHPGALTVLEVPCPHFTQYGISKIRLRHTTYQNVTCHLAWGPFRIEGREYTMVRVSLYDRHGRPIFAEPLVLLTTLPVTGREEACRVYWCYLLRAKIEGVFKFCKTVLGWEEAQVRDYASIRRLLALAFYLAGYFYASESELIDNPVIALICLLGGGKGGVSRYFFLQGLKTLLIYRTVLRFQHWLQQSPQEGVSFDDMMAFIT